MKGGKTSSKKGQLSTDKFSRLVTLCLLLSTFDLLMTIQRSIFRQINCLTFRPNIGTSMVNIDTKLSLSRSSVNLQHEDAFVSFAWSLTH